MQNFAQPPEQLTNTKPMDKTWKLWKESFLIFLRVAGFNEKENDIKADFLKNTIGKFGREEILKIEHDLNEELNDFEVLITKLDNHFNPPKKETEERYKFNCRSKKNNESIEAYIDALKEKAKTCNFGNLTDGLIRDRVILDVKDANFRKIIFQEEDLDLTKLILLYKQYEINTEKMKSVAKQMNSESLSPKPNISNQNQNNDTVTTPIARHKPCCSKCGTTHPPRQCPAFKIECAKCHEKGHFTQRCKNSNLNRNMKVQNEFKNKSCAKNPFVQIQKLKK